MCFTNAEIAPSLGRNLGTCSNSTGPCTRTVTIPIVEPGTLYEDRVSQLDLRLAKIFNFGGIRVQPAVDAYNLFNDAPVLTANSRFGSSWLNPSTILGGRLFKFGVQVDW